MTDPLSRCPLPPDFPLPWEDFDRDYPFVQALAGCPQDPIHHGEGDVWVHTRMVCEALLAMPGFRALPAGERAVVFAAALLHDVAKPGCTCVEDGRIRAPHHAPRGAVMARGILWRLDVPPALREQVTALVQHHQVPFYLIDQADPRRLAIRVSQTTRCDHLALLAEADARGRICRDPQRLLDQVALFAEFCAEHGVLRAPHRFASDHSRFLYFRADGPRDPDYAAHDDTRCEVVLMSGLPGAGKSRHAATTLGHLPQVSLDDLREALDVDPRDPQGRVVEAARQRAREYLRRGEPFVWNATNLSRKLRAGCIDLLAAYRARVRIVYVEAPHGRLQAQNEARDRGAPDGPRVRTGGAVPAAALERLLDRWQVPDLTEAHAVERVGWT